MTALDPRPSTLASGLRRIALCGLAGSGKSTAAKYLVERHGFHRLSYASPIKRLVRCLLIESGAGFVEVAEMIDGKLKETPTEFLCGKSPRYAMQTLGTEFGRDLLGQDIWRRILLRKVEALGDQPVVVDDARFVDEIEALRAQGFTIISVRRPCLAAISAHSSENADLPFDKILLNNGSISDLAEKLDTLFP